ncbi:MAG TPA: PP0621 family protein [Burkholderiales bacterium]|nr:PP0621 family protein [Burkholderiales bacterium]
MGKLIVLVLLVVVAVWLVRRALRSGQHAGVDSKPPVHGDLVSCAHCGVHVPRSEAREAGGGLYCSEDHARLGPGRR